MSLSSARFIVIQSLKGGDRAGQHGVRYPKAKPDGSHENAESHARKQFLEKAKPELASRIDEAQEPFRDAVESGQTIGEATTELQFGVNDGKSTDEAISNASKELFNHSTMNGKSDAAIEGKMKRKFPPKHEEDPKAEVSSEVCGSKYEGGTTQDFLDDSNKVDFHGQEDESVLGIGGHRAGKNSLIDCLWGNSTR